VFYTLFPENFRFSKLSGLCKVAKRFVLQAFQAIFAVFAVFIYSDFQIKLNAEFDFEFDLKISPGSQG